MVDLFRDEQGGAFYDTARDSSVLIVRPRSLFDNPIPSGNSAAAFAFARLEALTGTSKYGDHARAVFQASRTLLSHAPLSVSSAISFPTQPDDICDPLRARLRPLRCDEGAQMLFSSTGRERFEPAHARTA